MQKDFETFKEEYKYFFDRGISIDLFLDIKDRYDLLEQKLFEILKSLVDGGNYSIVVGYINTVLAIDTSFKTLVNISMFIDQINTDNVAELVEKLFANKKIKEAIEKNKKFNIDGLSDSLYLFLDSNEEDINKFDDDIYYEENILRSYWREIEKFPVLTKEEEQDLFHRLKNGDQTVMPKLINSNLKLVFHIAKRYIYSYNQAYSLDFIQDGNLGLIKAIERFNPDLGFKFSTYATWWIKRAVKVSVYKNCCPIKTTVNLESVGFKIKAFIDEYYVKNGKVPDYETISNALNISVDVLSSFLQVKKGITSLNEKVGDNDDGEILATYIKDNDKTPEEVVISKSESEEILKAIGNLTPREQEIILRRFGFRNDRKETLESIAADINMTREGVRQVELVALRKLRFLLSRSNVYEYAQNNPEMEKIYKLFKEYKKDDIESALLRIPLRYKRAFIKKLSMDQLSKPLTKKEGIISSQTIDLIKYILCKREADEEIENIESLLSSHLDFIPRELCEIIMLLQKYTYLTLLGIASIIGIQAELVKEIINDVSEENISFINEEFGIDIKKICLAQKEKTKRLQKN